MKQKIIEDKTLQNMKDLRNYLVDREVYSVNGNEKINFLIEHQLIVFSGVYNELILITLFIHITIYFEHLSSMSSMKVLFKS